MIEGAKYYRKILSKLRWMGDPRELKKFVGVELWVYKVPETFQMLSKDYHACIWMEFALAMCKSKSI